MHERERGKPRAEEAKRGGIYHKTTRRLHPTAIRRHPWLILRPGAFVEAAASGHRGGAHPPTGVRQMKTETKLSRRAVLAGVPALAVVAAPVAATALSGVPVKLAEASGDDAVLLRLVDDYIAAQAEVDRLSDLASRDSEKHSAANPMPHALLVRPEDEALGITTSDRRHRAADKIMDAVAGSDPRTYSRELDHTYDDRMTIDALRKPKWPVVEKIDLPADVEPWLVGGSAVVRYVEPSSAARARGDEIVRAYDEWQSRLYQTPSTDADMDREFEAACDRTSRLRNKIARRPAHSMAGIMAKVKAVASLNGSIDLDRELDDSMAASITRDLIALGAATTA
jgi:hypothetical protein